LYWITHRLHISCIGLPIDCILLALDYPSTAHIGEIDQQIINYKFKHIHVSFNQNNISGWNTFQKHGTSLTTPNCMKTM